MGVTFQEWIPFHSRCSETCSCRGGCSLNRGWAGGQTLSYKASQDEMSFNLIFHCTLRLFLIKLSEEKLVSYVGDLRLTLTRVFGGDRHYIQYCALLIKGAWKGLLGAILHRWSGYSETSSYKQKVPEKGVVECWVLSYISDQAESFSYKNSRVRRGKGIIFNIVRLVLSKRKGAVECYPTSVIRLRVQ